MDTEDFKLVQKGFILMDQNLAKIISLLENILVEIQNLNEWELRKVERQRDSR